MSNSFGAEYSAYYDSLYSDKDYEAECDLIESFVKRFDKAPVESVLDLGCGTGSHSVPLSRRGYHVTGVDLSQAMLEQASQKPGSEQLDFVHGDVRSVELHKSFDLVLMMFAVLGYQNTDSDVDAALGTVQRHLGSNRLFIGDVWYGPAVESIQPSERSKTVKTNQGELTRLASPSIDLDRNVTSVHYQLLDQDGQIVGEEEHHMRYFFPDELKQRFESAGLILETMVPFPEIDSALSESTWNALFVARAGV